MGLYHRDTASGLGVRMVPKLKLEHISLTSFSKMRVDLAAQVSYVHHPALKLIYIYIYIYIYIWKYAWCRVNWISMYFRF